MSKVTFRTFAEAKKNMDKSFFPLNKRKAFLNKSTLDELIADLNFYPGRMLCGFEIVIDESFDTVKFQMC